MKQEESQYLANDIEEIKKLPEWAQQRVGYGLSKPFLGLTSGGVRNMGTYGESPTGLA
jgi:hypothetical protein